MMLGPFPNSFNSTSHNQPSPNGSWLMISGVVSKRRVYQDILYRETGDDSEISTLIVSIEENSSPTFRMVPSGSNFHKGNIPAALLKIIRETQPGLVSSAPYPNSFVVEKAGWIYPKGKFIYFYFQIFCHLVLDLSQNYMNDNY